MKARLALLGCAFLVGCAGVQPVPSLTSVLKQQQGRFVVQVQAPGDSVEAVQGNFVWRKLAGGWQLDLLSPLGSTLARLQVNATGATLEQPGEPIKSAATASTLLASVLSVSVPEQAMRDWIEGRVAQTQVTDLSRDSEGRIIGFKQDGWSVAFGRYDQGVPRRIEIVGNQQGKRVLLRLSIDDATVLAKRSE
jgi:outer membrane lipoprotein LolB